MAAVRVIRESEVMPSTLGTSGQWSAHTLLTEYLWSNWTHVGFSVMFLSMGEKVRRSSGIHLSANLGKLLYTRPASRPATKAPRIDSVVRCGHLRDSVMHLRQV